MTDSHDPDRLSVNFDEVNTQGVRFLISEVDLGLTFSQIALESPSNPDRMRRNQSSARRAYDTAQKFLPRIVLTQDERQEIISKMAELRHRLTLLGELL